MNPFRGGPLRPTAIALAHGLIHGGSRACLKRPQPWKRPRVCTLVSPAATNPCSYRGLIHNAPPPPRFCRSLVPGPPVASAMAAALQHSQVPARLQLAEQKSDFISVS